MKTITCAALALLLCTSPVVAAEVQLKTDEDRTLYTLGFAISQNLAFFDLTPEELEIVKAGIADGVLKKELKVDLQTFAPKLQEFQRTRLTAVAAAERKAGQTLLDRTAAEKGATKTSSGLVIKTIKAGNGPSPASTDRVKVHYHGTLVDGTVFDSSVQRKEPATLALDGVIPCWTEGVQLMKVGGKSRLLCPADLAYGDRGAPPRIKPGATLVFEVELLEIVK